MSDYLPKELLVDIFTRLPVKSILRCTSVCKSWCSLIASPNFTSIHFNRKKQDDHILIQNYYDISHVDMYALFGTREKLDRSYLDFLFRSGSVSIVGSFNGILCLAETNKLNGFYFCNLSIRKMVKLAEPVYIYERCNTSGYTLGFGFVSDTNEYKVVRVVHTMINSLPPRVDLYKSSSGVWEDITHVSGYFLFIITSPQVYVNGASYWIASKLEIVTFRRVIVVFNMHDETFSDIRLPSSLTNVSRIHYDEMFLFVLEESLCLVDNNYDRREPIHIWMMREYGEPDSWVKLFSIQDYYLSRGIPLRSDIFWTPYSGSAAPTELEIANEFMMPIAIRKNGEILWKGNRRLLVSVDDTVKKFEDVGSGNCTNDWCYNPRYINYYKETLVLLDRWIDSCVGDACE